MGALTGLLHHMDWLSMLLFVMSGVACLICLTVHEISHGLAAYKLGDPTAKLNGRLTLNPLSHVDWIGLFLLLAVGVGWAQPWPALCPTLYWPWSPWGSAPCCSTLDRPTALWPISCCFFASSRCSTWDWASLT